MLYFLSELHIFHMRNARSPVINIKTIDDGMLHVEGTIGTFPIKCRIAGVSTWDLKRNIMQYCTLKPLYKKINITLKY